MAAEVLREVWRIVERRGGAVYRTEYVEDRWVPIDSPEARMATVGDEQFVGVSLDRPEIVTIRRKP